MLPNIIFIMKLERKLFVSRIEVERESSTGFKVAQIMTATKVNLSKTTVLTLTDVSLGHNIVGRKYCL